MWGQGQVLVAKTEQMEGPMATHGPWGLDDGQTRRSGGDVETNQHFSGVHYVLSPASKRMGDIEFWAVVRPSVVKF